MRGRSRREEWRSGGVEEWRGERRGERREGGGEGGEDEERRLGEKEIGRERTGERRGRRG